jgi:hypothetical protein
LVVAVHLPPSLDPDGQAGWGSRRAECAEK